MATTRRDRPRPATRRPERAALRRAVRARCVRRRVRGGRRRAVTRPGAAAGPRRSRRARPSRRVRGRRRVERWRGRRAAARSIRAGAAGRRPGRGAARDRVSVPAAWPRGRARGRRLVEDVLRRDAGLTVGPWRPVPFDAAALGARGRGLAPRVRPGDRGPPDRRGRARRCPTPPSNVAWSSPGAGSRPRSAEARAALAELSVPSASCRTVVYKGLVTGGRLPQLFPDLRAPLSVAYTVFHQRYATNTHPVWGLAQPFRLIAHNGEINTVRGNREQVRGRTRRCRREAIAAELLAAGPLLSPDGSDSLSLDEALELLMATGWELTPALLAAIPEALALRRSPHPHVATLRRRTAGFLAPWDGPAALVLRRRPPRRRDGRPQRAAAGVVRGHPRPARGGRVRGRRGAVRRGRTRSGVGASARASCCWSSRAAGRSSRTPRRRPGRCGRSRSTTRRGRPRGPRRRPPPRHSPTRSLPLDVQLRHLAGLDAERARLDIKTMALEGHEPLWSMGDDTPTPGVARLDRRSPTTCARPSPRSRTRPSTPSASAS